MEIGSGCRAYGNKQHGFWAIGGSSIKIEGQAEAIANG
jgi:hypothetical protein